MAPYHQILYKSDCIMKRLFGQKNLWCPILYVVEFISTCVLNIYTNRFLCSHITTISNSMRNMWSKVVILWFHICKWPTDPLWFHLKEVTVARLYIWVDSAVARGPQVEQEHCECRALCQLHTQQTPQEWIDPLYSNVITKFVT